MTYFFLKLLSKLVIYYNNIYLPGAYASEHILFLHTNLGPHSPYLGSML